MSDLETRLTEVLRAESESAPEAAGLAGAARARARTRRRTQILAAGAGAAAALAIPVAVVAMAGDEGGSKLPVAEDTTATDLEPVELGRWETWHGVTAFVPETWGYGTMDQWCTDGGAGQRPVVDRPGAQTLAKCTPGEGYGISFRELTGDMEPYEWPVAAQSSGVGYPAGAYVGATTVRGVAVTVVSPDGNEAQRILDSVAAVDDVDGNGCPVDDDPTVSGEPDSVSVCRYDGSGLVVQSERLVGSDAADARAALDSAPETAYAPSCPDPTEESFTEEHVVVLDAGTRFAVAYQGDQCRDQGVLVDARERRQLTADVLYWALSPGWSGSVDGNVPLPEQLRQRR